MEAIKTAVFPGSFDPFTKAHQDIVDRGLTLFDRVIIAIGVNSTKKGMFTPEERLSMIRDTFRSYSEERVDVQFFSGLTVDFCKTVRADFILRGMRNVMDFENESAIAQHNRELDATIETVFFTSPGHLSHISSTIVREILVNGGDATRFLPAEVLLHIQRIRKANNTPS